MGVGLLIGLFALTVLIIIGAFSLRYFIRKKSRLGIIISASLIIFLIAILFINQIDQITHSKSDVREDLKLAKIQLMDDFEIVENKVYGMPERFQKTKIKITTSDRRRLIQEIRTDPNFHLTDHEQILRDEMYSNPKKNSIVTANYNFQDYFIRESYFKEDDYVPILIIVRLTEKQNILEYERIED
jgi:hypothetical protein